MTNPRDRAAETHVNLDALNATTAEGREIVGHLGKVMADIAALLRDRAAEARERQVLALYRLGDLSLGKAAELLGVSRWDLPHLMQRHGIDLNLTAEEIKEDADLLARLLEKDSK